MTPYFYTFNDGSITVPALGTVTAQIQMNLDTNFELHQIGLSSSGTFCLDVVDSAKGESLINAPHGTHYPVPSSLLCGTTGHPMRFHEPIMVYAGQTLNITLIDTSGSANTIYLTFGGLAVKVRKWS
jgi:hypothetical protein